MVWPWRRKSRRRMARIAIEGAIASGTRKRVLKALREWSSGNFPPCYCASTAPAARWVTAGNHAALLRLREKGCRAVAGFGNISASGVYIGVAAEKIVSNPGCITGSIGVILRGNNLSKLLERVGIRFETVKSGAYKDILSPDRALSADERELLQALIDSSYAQFVDAVAEGRGLSPDTVRQFADGRVFSGAQGKELGLVDELGDEERARALAAELADLDEDCKPITLGKPKKKLLASLPGSSVVARLAEMLETELSHSGQALWLYRP